MILQVKNLVSKAEEKIKNAPNIPALNNIRVEYLGKRGHFRNFATILSTLPEKKRAIHGSLINREKKKIQKLIETKKSFLMQSHVKSRLIKETVDVSLPGRRIITGSLHPITQIINVSEKIFKKLNFLVVPGPEIEDKYHNFDALNIPPHHPARTNADTLWLNEDTLLRTQTSGVQIRIMKNKKPPIRTISSGKVYRNDYDKTHTPMFHQIEGIVVDKGIGFNDLKSTLHTFLNFFFKEDLKIRFRASYFPFTEPSAEIDILDKEGKWIEILGCGMIHPNVLKNVNVNSNIYSGFAFGIGVERLAMLRYGLSDLRNFFNNDLRFLRQFKK